MDWAMTPDSADKFAVGEGAAYWERAINVLTREASYETVWVMRKWMNKVNEMKAAEEARKAEGAGEDEGKAGREGREIKFDGEIIKSPHDAYMYNTIKELVAREPRDPQRDAGGPFLSRFREEERQTRARARAEEAQRREREGRQHFRAEGAQDWEQGGPSSQRSEPKAPSEEGEREGRDPFFSRFRLRL